MPSPTAPVLIAFMLAAATSWSSGSSGYRLVDLADLVTDSSETAAFDISPGGLVVGLARIGGGPQVAVRWSDGTAEVIDSIYGSEAAEAVSDDGVVVGTYSGTGNGWYARDGIVDCIPLPDPCGSFNNIWRSSSGHDINSANEFAGTISPDPDQPTTQPVQAYRGSFEADGSITIERLGGYLGASTYGRGLNDAGDVVGVSGNGLDYTALLFRDGGVIPLPDLGGAYNWAEAITNAGIAAGVATEPVSGPWPYDGEAVLWDTTADPVTVVRLGKLPGHRLSRALDLNDAGTVVGTSVDADFADQRAVLWHDGTIVDLNQLLPQGSDWRLEVATGISDAGEIVGYGIRDGLPGRRAFLLQPDAVFRTGFEAGHHGAWSHAAP